MELTDNFIILYSWHFYNISTLFKGTFLYILIDTSNLKQLCQSTEQYSNKKKIDLKWVNGIMHM